MDSTPIKAGPDAEPTKPPPDEATTSGSTGKRWSPWSTPTAKWSWGLMAIFSTIYFIVAILTSKEAAELAATMVFGLPLGFWLGIGMIIAGLVITLIYLAKVEH